MADGSLPSTSEPGTPVQSRPLLVADLFCGAGGLSNGAARAMRELNLTMTLIGVNHWPVAIETNKRNHPEHAARITCANLETALPRDHVPEGKLDLLMAAPSCVFHSRARGGRPVHDQQRMDPWHVVRWCTELQVQRVLCENVPEIQNWGPCDPNTGKPIASRKGEYFNAWIAALQAIGFRVEWRVLCCADYGDPTTRKRFFLIGRSDGGPLAWPEPSHARMGATDLLGTRQRWRGAREIIDWSIPGASIFTRKRPLKANTIRRMHAGAVKHAWPQPYVAALQALLDGNAPKLAFSRAEAQAQGLLHSDGSSFVLSTASGGAARDVREPLPTITTGGAGSVRPGCARPQLVEPIVLSVSNSSAAGVPRSCAEPIRTVTTAKGGDQAVAVPLVAPYYGGGSGLTATSVVDPVPSVTTKARFGLAEPFAFPLTHHGDTRTHAIDAPLPTITGANRGELGLATALTAEAGEIRIDINYRMIHWRELSRATSFDDEGQVYDFAGTGTEITKQIGNAVPNRTSKALAKTLLRDAA
ncbi:DNA cytosine methyltransferase [Xanthomonas perforans]|uniref:DNA cytosine methyltransferase n=1 Tax=Xanthomonas perforans TaxID=442694 RepID=UPI00235897DF|nr:DNA cytosine methyltransferase [Xanthomonas perforans]MDC9654380.1 DNA cytosine methyltransferase [Xanthomonas perforans]